MQGRSRCKHRIHVWYDSPSNAANQSLADPRRPVTHAISVGAVCGEDLAIPPQVSAASESD